MEIKAFPAWKKGLCISLAVSITAALFVFFAHFEEETLINLLQLRPEFLLWTFIMVFSLWVIEGLRIKLLVATLANGKKISLVDAAQVFLVTFFFAAATPFGAGEWPAHIATLHRKGLSLGEASAVTVARAFLTKLVFTLTALAFVLYYDGQPVPSLLNKVFLYAVMVSSSNTVVLFLLLWRPTFIESLPQRLDNTAWLARYMEKSSRGKKISLFLRNEINKFAFTARCLNRRQAGSITVIFLLTVLFWLCFFSIAPVLLMGLNMPAPYLQSLVWQFVVQIILPYIPIPGGSGVVELSLAGLFKFFVPSSVLGLFIMSWRFFTYYLLLFFGGLAALGSLKP